MAKHDKQVPTTGTDLASSAPTTPPPIPADIRELLGRAPVLALEDGQAYERVLEKMAAAIAPRDFVEWTWLKDIADLGWDAGRARRAKAVHLALARRSAIATILTAYSPSRPQIINPFQPDMIQDYAYRIDLELSKRSGGPAEESPAGAAAPPGCTDAPQTLKVDGQEAGEEDDEDYGDVEGVTFDDILESQGLTLEAVNDVAFQITLDDMERLQRIIDNANGRRDAVLREIDRRRDALARRLREALPMSDEIVDAEFENVPDAR